MLAGCGYVTEYVGLLYYILFVSYILNCLLLFLYVFVYLFILIVSIYLFIG